MEEFSKLKKEDQDFYTYLKLNALRSNNTISPSDKKLLEDIASTESRAKELEDLYNKVINKEKKVEDYTTKYDEYKKALEASIKEALAGKKELSEKSKNLIEYFKLEIKRVNTPLTEDEKNKVEELRSKIQEVRTLEEAHRRVNKKEIPTQVLKTLREKYKRTIKDEITTAGLNENEIMPDDTAIYRELEVIDKKEVPKEVTKSSLSNIKQVFDIKKKEEPKDDNLFDAIASNKSKSDEASEIEKLKEENESLKEKIDLLKTKIEYLEDQLAEERVGNGSSTDGIPKEFVELANYFKLDLKRTNNEITDEELEKLRKLTKGDNKMIDEIEDIVRMKANGELSIKEYKEKHFKVYDKYKKMLEKVVKENKGK